MTRAGERDGNLQIEQGTCVVQYAYDVGLSIDLDECARRIGDSQRHAIPRLRQPPRYFDFDPQPLRATQRRQPPEILGRRPDAEVDLLLFDFGAVSVSYRIAIAGPLADLARLSGALHDNEALLADSRQAVEDLLRLVHPAVTRPAVAPAVEDYVIFELRAVAPALSVQELFASHASDLGRILRADTTALSDQETADALQCRMSFSRDDLAVIDWNAALLFDRAPEDVRAVLEFANVELLELRVLDAQLDRALEESYEVLTRRRSGMWGIRPLRRELNHVARMQADSAILFEGINNALKLLGDHYLARLYKLTAQRFHLGEWDEAILRKIKTLESIYEKLSNQAATLRLEVLEWIIIVLIAVSIWLAL
jgi:hypothetical protein